jgi:DNA invertase Pin-like site-specific DNA recombinase
MIAVLGGLADVKRDLTRTRAAEGRSRAQKRGQRIGRKPKLTEAQQAEARKRRAEVPCLPNSLAAIVSEKARFRDCEGNFGDRLCARGKSAQVLRDLFFK